MTAPVALPLRDAAAARAEDDLRGDPHEGPHDDLGDELLEDAGTRPVSVEELIRERGPSLMRLAYLVTGQQADAEDLVQEVLTDVHRKWSRVAASEHPYAYVRTMLLNRHTSSRRRKWHGERPTDPVELPAGEVLADPTHRVDSDDALWQLLSELPARMRAVLVLRYFEDLGDADIAASLGVTESTVRATASRAIAQLRARGADHD